MAGFLKHIDLTLRCSFTSTYLLSAEPRMLLFCARSPFDDCIPKESALMQVPALRTAHTATQFKWAGANCARVPVIKKLSRRNSLRRSQQTIVHHCTFCTSANSDGIRGTSARVLFRKGGPNNLLCNSFLKKAVILYQQNVRHALRSPPIYCTSGLDYLYLLWWSPSASQPV